MKKKTSDYWYAFADCMLSRFAKETIETRGGITILLLSSDILRENVNEALPSPCRNPSSGTSDRVGLVRSCPDRGPVCGLGCATPGETGPTAASVPPSPRPTSAVYRKKKNHSRFPRDTWDYGDVVGNRKSGDVFVGKSSRSVIIIIIS